MKEKYKAIGETRISDAKARRYGERIAKLMEGTGYTTPRIVVNDARDPKSPLHDYFEWDQKVAAEKWRIEQAGYLLRHISIEVLGNDKQEIRGFYSVTPSSDMHASEPKVYVSLNTILTDKDKRDEVIAYALRELNGWMQRYNQYKEMKHLIKIMSVEVTKIKKVETSRGD